MFNWFSYAGIISFISSFPLKGEIIKRVTYYTILVGLHVYLFVYSKEMSSRLSLYKHQHLFLSWITPIDLSHLMCCKTMTISLPLALIISLLSLLWIAFCIACICNTDAVLYALHNGHFVGIIFNNMSQTLGIL